MTTLLPFINKQFNGTIWRMEIDSLSETVFVEIRNSEEKKVSFGSVNLLNGNINFDDYTTPERWLTGIETAYDGVLLLHHYLAETSPVHKGLIAVDAVTAQTLWSNYTYAFDYLSLNGPLLYNMQMQPKKLFLADIKTGATNRPHLPQADKELVNSIVAPQALPVTYLKQPLPIEPYGNMMHYLEYNNFRIVSLHSFTADRLQQHLYIMNDHEIVYKDILNDNIQKLQPEAFILHKNQLIYIKNKSKLKVLNF
ncbi:MAG: hypothetical protein JWR67_1077 [Mucilaginibacter sp.]|nr:hypothetical protein [Mucilaginibacter sp.]